MARILRGAAAAFALAGGVLLAAVVVLTCGSVVGRWVAATPIPGDIELTQLGRPRRWRCSCRIASCMAVT